MFWHPSENDLALAATHDAAPWKAPLIQRHVANCRACASVAAAHAGQARDLHDNARAAGGETQLPPFLAEAIIARLRHAPAGDGAIGRGWLASPFAQIAVALGIVLLAVLLVRWPPRHAVPGHGAKAVAGPLLTAPARAEAVVGARAADDSRGRMVVYGSPHRGRVEVSATGSGIGVVQADAATGTLTITAVSVEE